MSYIIGAWIDLWMAKAQGGWVVPRWKAQPSVVPVEPARCDFFEKLVSFTTGTTEAFGLHRGTIERMRDDHLEINSNDESCVARTVLGGHSTRIVADIWWVSPARSVMPPS